MARAKESTGKTLTKISVWKVCSQATAVSTLNLAQHLAGQTVVFEGQPLPVGFVYGCATLIEALVLYGSLDPKLRPEGGRDVTTVTFKLLMELGDARSNGTKRMRRWLLLTKLFLHRRDFFDQFLDDLTRAMQKPRREILAIVERLAKMNPEERMVYISMMTERRRSRLLTDAQTSGPRQITGEKDLPHQALLHVYRMARPRELEKVIKPLF